MADATSTATSEDAPKNGKFEEQFPDGKPKIRGQYSGGKKTGAWTTFGENGKPLDVAGYRNGLLDGPSVFNYPSGKPAVRSTYRAGKLAGPISVLDESGRTIRRVNYPNSRESVEQAWAKLAPRLFEPVKYKHEPRAEAPYKAGALSDETLDDGLKMLQLYRFLCGMPWKDMMLDPIMVDKAQHGAVILAKLGQLTHSPERPSDMDAAFFKLAYDGCHEANIFLGHVSLTAMVRGWMTDPGEKNRNMLGHRQWFLSPALQRTGFGACDKAGTAHIFDGGRPVRFERAFTAFPPEGFCPRILLEPGMLWSAHVNTTKARVPPAGNLHVTIQRLDEHYLATGEITAKVVAVADPPTSVITWSTIIFEPDVRELEAGRYWVEIRGIKTVSGGDAPLSYLVELIDIPEPGKDADTSKSSN